ncbi:MAG: methyltransferase domain-containing protein [Elusimicrobia bacterium]|nr:methyltransferase domain-containing protein [Elusimicrobiota bacterium]
MSSKRLIVPLTLAALASVGTVWAAEPGGLLPDLTYRHREPELMDDPALEMSRHIGALRGLERINRWSGSARMMWPPICELTQASKAQSLRVLDIATGAGDVPIGLWQMARWAGFSLHIDGCDRSLRAVTHAQGRAHQAMADVGFFQLDALTEDIPPSYDVIISSLFLHHLTNEQAVSLLRRMTMAARRMVLINDLVRHVASLTLAYLGTRLLSTSSVVHHDGPQSVLAAYTVAEVHAMARSAGLAGVMISRHWPYRFRLTWKRA